MDAEGVTMALRERYGETLLAVATYDTDGYEVWYIDDTIDEWYDEEARENIWRDLVLRDLATGRQEQLYPGLGSQQGNVQVLEEGVVAHFRCEADNRIFVAFHGRANPSIHELRDLCNQH